jgi:hypothetical protein
LSPTASKGLLKVAGNCANLLTSTDAETTVAFVHPKNSSGTLNHLVSL